MTPTTTITQPTINGRPVQIEVVIRFIPGRGWLPIIRDAALDLELGRGKPQLNFVSAADLVRRSLENFA